MHTRNNQDRYAQERKLPVFPSRGGIDAKPRPTTRPMPTQPIPTPAKPALPSRDLAAERSLFGFDDIPTDDENMKDVRFRDIFAAWIKQGIKHSPLEKKQQHLAKLIKERKFTKWQDDLKWALQADLDEPVKPRPKIAHHTPKTPVRHGAAHQKQTAPHTDGKTIDINISLGSLPKLPQLPRISTIRKKLVRMRPSRKTIVMGSILSVAFISLVFGYSFVNRPHYTVLADGSRVTVDGKKAPNYDTMLPAGKKIEDFGGWTRVSPPNNEPVFAYGDKIGSVQISVSQQALPKKFKQNTSAEIAELAKGYSADEKVKVNDTTIYIGSSAAGPQSVILAKNDLLILIKSSSKLTDDQWAEYVNSLK